VLLAALCGCGHTEPGILRTNGPATAVATEEHDALDLSLSAAAQALRDQGFVRGTFQDRGFLPTSGRVARPVLIEPHTCSRFVAVATASIVDLDAALYRADGSALVEDDGSDARPSLELCGGEVGVSAYYALHAYQGVGAYATAQFVRPAVSGDDLMIAQVAGEGSALTDLSKALRRRGFEDAAPRVEFDLSAERPVRIALPVEVGACYTLAVEGAMTLNGVSLRLLADDGRELAFGVATEALASLQYCAERTADLGVEVSARAGQGKVRVGRFRASQSVVGGSHSLWLGEPSPSSQAWREPAKSTADVRRDLSERGAKTFVLEERALAQGQVEELMVKRSLGACETWRVQVRPGLVAASMRIEGLDGHVYAEADSEGGHASMEFCGRRGPARVMLIGRTGFGSVTVTGEPRAESSAKP
jgi:hypothetical protein